MLLGCTGWLWSAGVLAQSGGEAGCAAHAPVYPRWMQVLAPVQRVAGLTAEEQEELLAMQQVLALQWAGSAMETQECPDAAAGGASSWPLEAAPGVAAQD